MGNHFPTSFHSTAKIWSSLTESLWTETKLIADICTPGIQGISQSTEFLDEDPSYAHSLVLFLRLLETLFFFADEIMHFKVHFKLIHVYVTVRKQVYFLFKKL